MRLVPIEPGTFTMGQDGPLEDYLLRKRFGEIYKAINRIDFDEKPARRVTITRPFPVGVTEVTVGQYRQFDPGFMRDDPKSKPAADDAATGVTWKRAVAVCKWLALRLMQFLSARQRLPGAWVVDAHAPSPDVCYGPPGLHSLGGVCAPPSVAPLAAYAGSQGMGTPSRDLIRLQGTHSMALLGEPENDERVEKHGQRGSPFERLPAPALRLLEAEALLAGTEGDLDAPAYRVPADHLLGGRFMTRRVEGFPAAPAFQGLAGHDAERAIRHGEHTCHLIGDVTAVRPTIDRE